MQHRDARRGRGVALGGRLTTQRCSSATLGGVPNLGGGRHRSAWQERVSLTPQGHPPAPPSIATRPPSTSRHYSPSVAFAMMLRWISLEPA